MRSGIKAILRIYILSRMFLTLPCQCATAAEPEMTFRHLTVTEGLSQSTVLAITQDRLGKIWVGTQNGLNVFDGYEFKTYYTDAADSLSLPDNHIISLSMGKNGDLWIGTSSGLAGYDFETGHFSSFPVRDKGHIYSILEAEEQLLLSTDHGLWYYSPADGHLSRSSFIGDRPVRSAYFADGTYVVATDRGLISIEGDKFQDVEAFRGMDVYAVAQVGGTGWWIGTYGNGLFRTDSHFNIIRQYTRQSGDLPSNHIRVLQTDGYGRLWVGTYEGLAIYDDISGSFRTYVHTDEATSLSHNSIRAIFVDGQNGVWMGTWFGGVNYWNRQDDKLRTVSLSGSRVYGFVSCLEEDPYYGCIWIGTNDDGVWKYYPEQDRMEPLDMHGAEGNIKCISIGSDGYLYVGTHLGGLLRIDRRTGRIRTFNIGDKVTINNSCYSLMEEKPSRWWAGTLDGLFLFDSARETFSTHPAALLEPRLAHDQISCLLKDSKERIWIGTDVSLYMYLPTEGKLLRSNDLFPELKLGDYHVTRILQDRSGNIWIATKRGLIRYQENGSSRLYTTKDGLPNDQVCAILDDESGILWMSTGSGICRLDPDNGAIRSVGRSRKNEYNQGACCAGSDGYFNFGGLGGITRFRPHDMYSNPFTPKAFFEEASVNGKGSCKIRRDADGNMTYAELSPDVNNFSVSWSVVNPLSYGDNTFRYRLEGFDNSWYETSARHTGYSNLPPGRYSLHLRVSNSEGLECKEETVLDLRVRPRWWQTTVARIAWLLLGILIAIAAAWLIASRISTGIKLEQEKRERKRLQDSLDQTRALLVRQFSGNDSGNMLSADEEFLKKAVQTVEENIDNENFSSSDFAAKMLMSRSNLYLRITTLTGESATQFIRRIRLEKACQLLLERKYSIAEISAKVGFGSPSYFTTAFKKNVGCLPTEYGRK